MDLYKVCTALINNVIIQIKLSPKRHLLESQKSRKCIMSFLDDNNACGQNLLNIVSVGNSIIAEILRLKDYVPSIYR